ncbi:hypothetical protein FB451DRAFT_1168992 [Mycena latifolia]|nr:hypothetical protein FB451DRAFT_1168992 [Mycena latifolia]
MFFKTLALSLAALALVHVAPSMQTPACSVDVGASVAAPKFNTLNGPIRPGTYEIYNSATRAQLRSSHIIDEAIFTTNDKMYAGNYAKWNVEPLEDRPNEYKISNVGLGQRTFAGIGLAKVKTQVRCGVPLPFQPSSFIVEPAYNDDGTFFVRILEGEGRFVSSFNPHRLAFLANTVTARGLPTGALGARRFLNPSCETVRGRYRIYGPSFHNFTGRVDALISKMDDANLKTQLWEFRPTRRDY